MIYQPGHHFTPSIMIHCFENNGKIVTPCFVLIALYFKYIGLENFGNLQYTVKFYMHLLYIFAGKSIEILQGLIGRLANIFIVKLTFFLQCTSCGI